MEAKGRKKTTMKKKLEGAHQRCTVKELKRKQSKKNWRPFEWWLHFLSKK